MQACIYSKKYLHAYTTTEICSKNIHSKQMKLGRGVKHVLMLYVWIWCSDTHTHTHRLPAPPRRPRTCL